MSLPVQTPEERPDVMSSQAPLHSNGGGVTERGVTEPNRNALIRMNTSQSPAPLVVRPDPGVELWVITGGDTNLGYWVTRFALEAGKAVIVTSRNPAKNTHLAQLVGIYSTRAAIVAMEFDQPSSIQRAADDIHALCNQQLIDVLVLIEGAGYDTTTPTVATAYSLRQAFAINTIGPLLFVQQLFILLRKSDNARVINVSSLLGSNYHVVRDLGSHSVVYSVSRAASHMLMSQLANDPSCSGITFLSLVTGLKGPHDYTTMSQAPQVVDRIMTFIGKVGPERNGSFVDFNGQYVEY